MKLHIVTAVVDTTELILYLDDGTTYRVPQGDPKLAEIVKDITPVLTANKIAVIETEDYTKKTITNVYLEQEKNSKGIVKFFKVAKDTLLSWFKKEEEVAKQVPPVPPMRISTITLDDVVVEPVVVSTPLPEPTTERIAEVVQASESAIKAERALAAVTEIIKHAVPAEAEKFNDPQTDKTHEVVAVVNNQIITGVAAVEPQIKHAGKLQNYAGITKFLERVASVADKRRHSVKDLMRFMERGDLPIADDGCIIIYKVLNKVTGKDIFQDVHSGNVIQKVGSYVCMDESMVDHDRGQECSNGLHVARRDYIANFNGTSCVLAKVAPEDVIAVPSYDSNKMRVCGYHIIFELSTEAYELVRQKKAFTDNAEAQRMLGKAISGDHIGKIEEVRITQQKGGGLVIIPLMSKNEESDSMSANVTTSVDPLAQVIPLNEGDAIMVVDPVDPKKIAEEVQQIASQPEQPTTSEMPDEKEVVAVQPTIEVVPEPVVTEPKEKAKPPTRAEKAQALYAQAKAAKGRERILLANELLNYKAKVKVAWSALGMDEKAVLNLKSWAE